MPNRILREGILASERVNVLSAPAEVFYRRLMSVVDDFGRFYAKPELLRAACYPLKLDKVGNPDIGKWILETREAALVRTYTVDRKEYLELLDFRQQVRARASKFPQPTSMCVATATQESSESVSPAHLDVDVSVVDITTLSGKPDLVKVNGHSQATEILSYLNEKAGKAYEPVKVNIDLIEARLKEGATTDVLREVVDRKCAQWLGKEQEIYLRPATLFNRTKFAQYQGERDSGDDWRKGVL